MKTFQFCLIFGLMLSLASAAASGLRFYRPYEVFRPRTARWPLRETSVYNGPYNIHGGPTDQEDLYKLISYLNDVGRRRK